MFIIRKVTWALYVYTVNVSLYLESDTVSVLLCYHAAAALIIALLRKLTWIQVHNRFKYFNIKFEYQIIGKVGSSHSTQLTEAKQMLTQYTLTNLIVIQLQMSNQLDLTQSKTKSAIIYISIPPIISLAIVIWLVARAGL